MAAGVIDGAEVLLLGAWGMEGSCGTTCCCEGVDTGMKPGADGTVGILGRAAPGIMTPGAGTADGIGCSVFTSG